MTVLFCLVYATSAARADAPGLGGDTVVFGGDAAYPPFEWVDNGQPTGLNVGLQRAIAAAGGVRAEHRLENWPEIVRGLENGSIDVVAMFRSADRERRFRFTQPFDFVNHSIYGLHDSANVTSVNDLAASRVAVEELSYAHQKLRETGSKARLVLESNTVAALEAVRDGRADYAIVAEGAADYLVETRDLELRSIGPRLWPAEYVLAVRKDRQEFAGWLDRQLTSVMESGEYRAIQQEWESESHAILERRWQDYAIVPLSIILLLGSGYLWSMRKTVMDHAYRLVDESRLREQAESRLRWTEDHFVDTGMPKAHRFVEEAGTMLSGSDQQGRKQLVALRLAELPRIMRLEGHEAGQQAILQFAERLRQANFMACGQLGRDAFAILGSKARIAREFRSALLSGDTVAMNTPLPAVFAGAATWPQHGETVAELLRKAESALDYAVRHHERWIDFRSFMEPEKEHLDLLARFRESGGSALHPEFQPQIDLASGRVAGAEVLARWKYGDRNVSPAVFIPLLEDAGLVQHVTRRMVTHAIRVSARLRQKGMPCPISVNVTARDLLSWRLSRHIFSELRRFGGIPEDLTLELTETTVVERPEVLQWKMKRLVRNGVSISIDDFGTGYSSLAHLSHFPVAEIKVDKSFVLGMLQSDRDLRIVTSTIAMAHELGLLVVAEGVETEDALNVLRKHHCDRAQGYVLSRPIPESKLADYLAQKRVVDRQAGSAGKIAPFPGRSRT